MRVEALRDPVREEEHESEWEAAPAIAVVIALQILLAVVSEIESWKLWHFVWWIWLVPIIAELPLFVALAWRRPRRRLEQLGMRRTIATVLIGFVSLANCFLLLAVIASLVSGREKSGAQLLLKGFVVWSTNVIVFALWYWAYDRGGPVRRRRQDPPNPDFQFPQLENPQLAPENWQPALFDYVYVSFTNALAFSPTDAMPLSRWAKWLMLAESATSAVTILLVAARAVNIFK